MLAQISIRVVSDRAYTRFYPNLLANQVNDTTQRVPEERRGGARWAFSDKWDTLQRGQQHVDCAQLSRYHLSFR